MIHIKLMVIVNDLLKSGRTVTKREVYYQNEAIFRTQADLDGALDRLARTFAVPRDSLGIVAGSKGFLLAPTIDLEGCKAASGKRSIPTNPVLLGMGTCPFVLVVEKEAVFQTIIDDYEFLADQLGPFAVITGKGYPCMATRKLVSQLGRSMRAFVMVDFDPYGLEIAWQYRTGSTKLPSEAASLACPHLEYAGVGFQDIDRYGDVSKITERLSDADRKRLQGLQTRIQRTGQWADLQRSIAKMLDRGIRAEIEVIPNTTTNFFTRTFLLDKLRQSNI